PGWHPVAFLYLDFEPGSVDVNVHPMKSEVRFRDLGSIYPLVFHAVRRALEPKEGEHVEAEEGGDSEAGASHEASSSIDPVVRTTESFTARRPSSAEVGRHQVEQATKDYLASDRKDEATPFPRRPMPQRRAEGDLPFEAPVSSAAVAPTENRSPSFVSRPTGPTAEHRRAFQILDSYIVTEEKGGVAILDQHALHEKILFEEIFERFESGDILRQKLIVPDVVELDIEDMPLVERAQKLLAYCGYEVEPFGDREVAVHSVPKLFERVKSTRRVAEFLREAFLWLREDGSAVEDPSPKDASGVLRAPFRTLASMMACKRAVKAGTRLNPQEIQSLLEKAELADDPRHCPHGRPTRVHWTERDLEAFFDRK
ncbi:MAG: hypothetical protein AAF517_04365, partial [Planctomycetota bacterium]